jgi:periplasmic divalent cation tolerance protein
MNARLIYITASSAEEAALIGRGLVEERLAACANVLGGIRSFYWWEDEVQDDQEVALIAKTTSDKVDAVVARVKSLHSYSCPCVVALPIEGGNPAFLDWIKDETTRG